MSAHGEGPATYDLTHFTIREMSECGKELRTYNVFHVPEALGGPFIPAQQEFVVPCAIRSVLGFGGLLPSGEMFAVILFLKVPLAAEAANLFKALSLNVKMAILPFDNAVFA